MISILRRSTVTLTLAAALALGLAACAAPDIGGPSTGSVVGGSADDDHGAVAGATELTEPALGLTTIDPAGVVTHLDLLDGSVTDLGAIGATTAMTADGRYLFAQTVDGIRIVDSGRWTWDHVDHFHYYRAEPRLLGTVVGPGSAAVATTTQSGSGSTGIFFADSGEAVLLDTAALAEGRIEERFRLDVEPHAGLVVPVGTSALVTELEPSYTTTVVGYDAEGHPTGLQEECPAAAGTITTRVGAVIGCHDGALLAHDDAGELVVERIPYPAGTSAPPATAFANREGRPTVAGLAGDDGIWLLDTRERSWALLPAPAPLVAVTAVDDDTETVLALAAEGRLLVLSGADGSVRAATAPLVAASLAAGSAPTLIADQHRAYLGGPAEQRLFEIDFADAARVARTFDTAGVPAFTAETGR